MDVLKRGFPPKSLDDAVSLILEQRYELIKLTDYKKAAQQIAQVCLQEFRLYEMDPHGFHFQFPFKAMKQHFEDLLLFNGRGYYAGPDRLEIEPEVLEEILVDLCLEHLDRSITE